MQLLRLVTAFMLVATLLLISPLTCIVASNTAAAAFSSTFTLTVIVEPPNGGWLTLSPGTYVFEANTVVQIYWWHSPDYILEFYDINGTILGPEQITRPYNITMDANYVLKAIFVQVAPLQVSLSQLLTAPSEDGLVSFAATTYGGRGQKTCLWYLNNARVTTHLLDADSDSWSFVPSTPGTYHILVKASSE